MPRKPRIDYEGAWHHVFNRGARKAPIFDTDEAAGTFIATVGEASERFGMEVHGYAVMPNHYHLLVRSVRGNLSRSMRHLGAVFTQDRNRLFGWDGPVFNGRFKSQLIKDERYLLTVSAYIHLNPVRANLIRRLDQRAWTSLRSYLGVEPGPEWLDTAALTRLAGGKKQYASLVGDFRHRRVAWPDELDAETGWLQGRRETPSASPQRRRRGKLQAVSRTPSAVLATICDIAKIELHELANPQFGRSGNPARRLAVLALAHETELSHAEIGALVDMSVANVSITLKRARHATAEPLASWRREWERRTKVLSVES